VFWWAAVSRLVKADTDDHDRCHDVRVRRDPNTLGSAAIAALLIAVVALGIVAFRPTHPPTEAGFTAPAPQPTSILTPQSHGAKVLLLGDSYSDGTGAASPSLGYAPQLAAALGWHLTTDSVPGGGYVHDGTTHNGPLAKQIDRANLTSPDLIVVQEGYNDSGGIGAPDLTQPERALLLQTAENDLLVIRQTAIRTPILVVGCFAPGGPTSNERAVDRVLHNAARYVTGTYFADPLALSYPLASDNVHPSTQGHAVIAVWLMRAIHRLGVTRNP
jgi:lysophospholipase L1-like esterase